MYHPQDTEEARLLVIDVPWIFHQLGDTPGVLALCRQTAPEDMPPSPAAVAVWKHRERIAYEWLPVVLSGLARRNIPIRYKQATLTAARERELETLGL